MRKNGSVDCIIMDFTCLVYYLIESSSNDDEDNIFTGQSESNEEKDLFQITVID